MNCHLNRRAAPRCVSAGAPCWQDASFAIREGEFIGVLGPNGAGKTTLMRAVLGLLPPSAGTVRVFGRSPRRGDRPIGYLPQLRTVLPDLRVRGFDFIASSLNGERWGLPSLSRHDRREIDETLDAGRRARSCAARAVRHVGRRAATPAAGAGADRFAASCCCSTSR